MKLWTLAALLGLSLTAAAAPVKDPDTYTYLTLSDQDSLDPAYSYDTASHLVIFNVYESLFFYDGSSTEKLVPHLATKVPSRANGLISPDGKTYTIPLRKGVKFQDGSPFTPEDARYSLMRFMLQDRDAGPSSLLMEPLLGYPATRDAKGVLNPNSWKDADKAVSLKGDNLILKLPRPDASILTILAQWAPIVSRAWAVKNGDWDGTEATWAKFNNPKKESTPFYNRMNGTGPFALERWDSTTKTMILARNEGYWRAPAKLKRVIIKGVDEFATRKLKLQAGDADAIYADRPVISQLEGIEGVQLIDDLPTVEMNPAVYFTFDINPTGNPNIGSGKFDGDGITKDFFADINVRKGFAYSFDYEGFLKDVFRGKGVQATSAIPRALAGHNPKQKTYKFDPAKAAEHFKKAHGGKVWEKGFRFTLTFNSGNVPRQTLCQIIKRNVEALNPKFRIDVRPVQWSTFLDGQKAHKLPMFTLGWNADYPDPHNFTFPFYHSKGQYPVVQNYSNPAMDKLVEAGQKETDPAKRKKIYFELQALAYEEVPHLVLVDTAKFRTQRSWVKGWYHNPIFPDSPYGSYFYPIYKQ